MKENYKRIICAPIAGSLEAVIMHPLDTMKVRIQTNHIKNLFRNLYRGIFPYYTASCLKLTTRWTVFETLRKESTASNFIAGAASGLVETLITSPLELLKTQKQVVNKKNFFLNNIKKKGVLSLYRGFAPLFIRQSINQSTRFGTYMYLKDLTLEKNEDPILKKTLPIALFSSCLGPIINHPFDVVKSRLMDPSNDKKYNSTIETFVKMKREEGIKSLYKGFTLRILRVGIGSAIVMVSIEKLMFLFS